MFKDNILKKSFFISFLLHFVILVPWTKFGTLDSKSRKTSKVSPILVCYSISPEEKIVIQKSIIENKDEKPKLYKVNDTHEINDKNEKVEQKKVEDRIEVSNVPNYEEIKFEVYKNEAVSLTEKIDTQVVPLSILNYYHAIREEIRKKAYYYKPNLKGRGSVTILFAISSDGVLQNLIIDDANSTEVRILREAALKSVKYASPFPPFPLELKNDIITFSIAIEFELEGR